MTILAFWLRIKYPWASLFNYQKSVSLLNHSQNKILKKVNKMPRKKLKYQTIKTQYLKLFLDKKKIPRDNRQKNGKDTEPIKLIEQTTILTLVKQPKLPLKSTLLKQIKIIWMSKGTNQNQKWYFRQAICPKKKLKSSKSEILMLVTRISGKMGSMN